MSFDDFTKKHIDRLAAKSALPGPPTGVVDDDDDAAEAMPDLINDTIPPIMQSATAALNKLGLNAELKSGAAITDLYGRHRVRVAGATISIFELTFEIPPLDLKDGIAFIGRVSLLVLVPHGILRLEIYGSDIAVGAHPAAYIKLDSMLPRMLTPEAFEASIKKAIEHYIAG